MKDWYFILANIAQWSPALPLLLALIRIRKLSSSQKWLGLLLIMTLLLQWIGDQVGLIYKNNAAVFHIYVWVEFSLIALIYQKEYSRIIPFFKIGIIGLIGGFTLLSLTDLLFLNGPLMVPTYARTTEIILIILMGFAYFAFIYWEMKVLFMEKQFLFWFTTGNLLFFSFNLLTYFFSNLLNGQHVSVAIFLSLFHSFTAILLYVFYAIAVTRNDPVAESA